MARVGERLRELRKSAGMTQDELGELLGMAGATVSRMETGALGIDADSVPKLAAALGVPPSAFYESGKLDHDAKSRVIWPRVERAAQRAAELTAERVRSAVREDLEALLARGASEARRVGEPEPDYFAAHVEELARDLPEEERQVIDGLLALRARQRQEERTGEER